MARSPGFGMKVETIIGRASTFGGFFFWDTMTEFCDIELRRGKL
jgi:hypothetical protein